MPTERYKTIRKMLAATAAGNGVMSAEAQKGAWAIAVKDKDKQLLANLIIRKDLCPDLQVKARESGEDYARIAYLSRKGIDPVEAVRLLESENRTPVLTGVCRKTNLLELPEVDELLYKRMQNSPTKGLAAAIVSSEHASGRLLVLAFAMTTVEQASSMPVDGALHKQFAKIAADPGLLDEFVNSLPTTGTPDVWVPWFAGVENLTSQQRLTLVEKFLKPAAEIGDSKGAKSGYYTAKRTVVNMVPILLGWGDADKELLDSLESVLRPHKKTFSVTYSMVQKYKPGKGLFVYQDNQSKLEVKARTAKDSRTLASIARSHYTNVDILEALAENPNLKGNALATVAERLAVYREYTKLARFLELRPDDEAAIIAYCVSPRLAKELGWDIFKDPQTAKKRILAGIMTYKPVTVMSGRNRPAELRELIGCFDDDDPAFMDIPWGILEDLVAYAPPKSDAIVSRICNTFIRRQAEKLGSDPQKWETLAVLSDNFNGTLEELLEVSSKL